MKQTKRIAIIGMSGNSLFYNSIDNEYKLVHEEVGGKGYNQAVACARNGLKVSYLSACGNDKIGIKLEEYMKNEGIDTFFVRKDKPSLEASIYVSPDGANDVRYNQDNVATLDKKDVDDFENEIIKSDCLLLQFEYSEEVIKEAILLAKKHNKLIVVNPAPMIYPSLELLKYVDIITPNEEEAYKLFGIDRKLSIDILTNKEQKSEFKLVLNTVGSEGVVAVDKEDVIKYKPIKVKAVDTTGAGDTFNGVFIANYLNTCDLCYSIKKAVVGSGISVTRKYVMDAIPSSDEINSYIKENNMPF